MREIINKTIVQLRELAKCFCITISAHLQVHFYLNKTKSAALVKSRKNILDTSIPNRTPHTCFRVSVL